MHLSHFFSVIILSLALAAGAHAQYPSKPVRIIVPSSPGNSSDIMARLIADKLSQTWGQPVLVENRPGADGRIGAEVVAKSAPDGHTLFIPNAGVITINPALFAKMSYDPVKDFAPVTQVATIVIVLAAHPSLAANSVGELVALAKAKPGALHYASAGNNAGIPYLAGALLRDKAGIDVVHVPYKANAQAQQDLLGGQIQFMYDTLAATLPHAKSGRLKVLAVVGSQRSPVLPEVPTLTQAGYPGTEGDAWAGLLAPGGTPRAVVEKIHADVVAVLQQAEVRERLTALGLNVIGNKPDEFAAVIKADTAKWAAVIRANNIKAE
jgi:tripartite-type tricarboxylate transporter receptor subunit TctC